MTSLRRLPVDLLTNRSASRRQFLKRAVVMTAAVPTSFSLLAACGGDDDDDDEAEATATEPEPTETAASGAEPTATEAEEAPQPTATEAESVEPTATEAEPTEAEATATEAPSTDGPKQGGTMTVMGHHEVASLSPDDAGPFVHWVIVANIHDGLLNLDPFFVLQPTLCESFEVADDGLTYTFNLRDGVLFHDGESFTATDVQYSFDYYRNPDNATITAQNYAGIDTIDTPDDLSVIINMATPNAAFLARGATSMIVPEHHHSAIGEDNYKNDAIGTGPWKVKEWRPAEFTELEAFDDYFGGRPLIDIFREDIVPEPSVRAIALENGEADSAVWPIGIDDNVRLRDDPGFSTFVTSALHTNHFVLNNEKPYLSDKRVRQAMMYAINRDSLINDLWLGAAVKATANISPALEFYYEPDVKQYPYDPDQAAALLDEAGWTVGDDGVREKDGVKLAFTVLLISGDQARRPLVEATQANLKDVNIEMTIEEQPLSTIREGWNNGTNDSAHYNSTYGGASGDPDASTSLKTGQISNQSRFSNTRVDELLDLGLQESDPEARREIYSEIQKIVAEEVPYLFIMHWDWFNFFNARIKGLPDSALTGTELYRWAHTYWIDESS